MEEQQSLLAENYEVFSDGCIEKPKEQSKSENVSRFVNPFFCSEVDGKEEITSPSDPISASLSLLKENEDETENSSGSESDISDMSDYFVTPTLRPAVNAG